MLFPIQPWEYATPVTTLTELGRALYREWAAELMQASGIDPEYRETGLLIQPPIDIERASAWCALHNVRANLITGSGNSSASMKSQSALHLPDIAQVRNPRLIKSLTSALKSHGVRIRENTEVIKIATHGHRVTNVLTATETLSARAVIVCAGAWSSALLAENALGLKIFPVRGQMLLYQTPFGTLDTMLLKENHYLVPRADGHILAGSTRELVGFENATTEVAAIELHQATVDMLPSMAMRRPIAHWAGLRPGSPGNLPVIGRHPTIENLYMNSGHFRYGLTMAPAAAQILVTLLAGKKQPLDTIPYTWKSNCETPLLK